MGSFTRGVGIIWWIARLFIWGLVGLAGFYLLVYGADGKSTPMMIVGLLFLLLSGWRLICWLGE